MERCSDTLVVENGAKCTFCHFNVLVIVKKGAKNVLLYESMFVRSFFFFFFFRMPVCVAGLDI